MTAIFHRHQVETSNGRAVRMGNDPIFITGYHQLWNGYHLQGSKGNHRVDIAVAPLDAPDRFPAGCCQSRTTDNGTRCVIQPAIWRD